MIIHDLIQGPSEDASRVSPDSIILYEIDGYVPLTTGLFEAHQIRYYAETKEIGSLIISALKEYIEEAKKDIYHRKDYSMNMALGNLISSAIGFLRSQQGTFYNSSAQDLKRRTKGLVEDVVSARNSDIIVLDAGKFHYHNLQVSGKSDIAECYEKHLFPDNPILIDPGLIKDFLNEFHRNLIRRRSTTSFLAGRVWLRKRKRIEKVKTTGSSYLIGDSIIYKLTHPRYPVMVMGVKKGKEADVLLSYINTGKLDRRYVKVFLSQDKRNKEIIDPLEYLFKAKGYKVERRKDKIAESCDTLSLVSKSKSLIVEDIRKILGYEQHTE